LSPHVRGSPSPAMPGGRRESVRNSKDDGIAIMPCARESQMSPK
jgi:hypothetical protein